MPKPMGRPKTPRAKALGRFISTRLTPGDYREIHDAIARSGQSKSDWLRDALLENARKG